MKVTNNVNFKAVEKQMRAAIGLYADTAAKKMEGSAKKNAPWIDRSSHARTSIQGDFKWSKNQCLISISGNMNYSVFLELAMGKKYAVLYPTVQSYSTEIFRGYQRLVK